jgi:cytochrome c biogenesis protein CcmG/thiol:disulfide interchange protein DsbE
MLSFTFTLTGCQDRKSESESNNHVSNDSLLAESENQADLAPDFTLPKTDGSEIKLSDYKGKIVLIDFWATWCPPCRRGIPDLIDIQKKYREKLVIIGISLDTETKPDVIPFIKKYGINYPVVYGNMEVVQAYGNIQAIPTSFIVDQNGQIVDKHVGLVDKAAYLKKIEELLKKS